MKKLLLPIVAFAMGASGAWAAVGDTFTVDGVTYAVTSGSEVEVSEVDTKLTEVPLSETVSDGNTTYTLTAIGDRAFYYSKVTSITIPNTVTELKYGAFMSADKLATVNFGTGLKTIGQYAFYGAPLTQVAIPEGVESVGGSCFFTAKELTRITFPSTLKSLGESCFYNSPKLEEVVLPDGLETLGQKAFMRCKKLTTVNVPQGITEIGDGTFYECTSLTSLPIPEGVTTIGQEAFWGSGLTSVTLPASLESLGGAAFSGTKISKFEVAAGNTHFTTVDDILYTADKSLLISLPPVYAPTTVTVDPACVGISYGAFDRSEVTTVVLGDKVRAIDECAFVNSKLATINFPESVVFIGEQAFANTKLTEVTLPKNMPLVQDGSFAQTLTLRTLTIPAGVTDIAIRAFTGCTSLSTINCEGMTPPELEDWYESYENPFYNIASNCVVNVPSGALDTYKASSWKNAFSASQFNGSLASALQPVAADPEDGTRLSSFDGVTITFGESVSVAKSSPAVTVIKGRLVAGVPIGDKVSVDTWMAVTSGTNGVRVFPADWDGYTSPFNLEYGNNYFVTIPAGTFKNSAGELSEEIVLEYEGTYVAPTVKFTGAEPADGSVLPELSTLTLNFEESVNLQTSRLGAIKVYEGAVEDGMVVNSWWSGISGETSGTAIGLFSCDEYGDGYSEPVTFIPGKDYTVVLPEGLFRLGSSYSTTSPEIVLHYQGPELKAFEITSVTPADGESLKVFESLNLTFTEMAVFDEAVSEQIKAYLTFPGDDMTDGDEVRTMDFWAVPENYSTELTLFAIDMDGYTVPIPLDYGRDLYLVLPEGLFHTLDGQQKTPETILHFLAPAAEFEVLSITPESGSTLSTFESMTLSFSDMAVYQENAGQNIKAVKATSADDLAAGKPVSVDFWAVPENYSSELTLFPSDWDGFTMPVAIDHTADLFIVIPEGTFTTFDGQQKSPEMTVRYTNGLEGVSSVGINDSDLIVEALAGAVRVVADKFEIFTVSGQLVAVGSGDTTTSLQAGIYTVRAAGPGSALRIAKVVVK